LLYVCLFRRIVIVCAKETRVQRSGVNPNIFLRAIEAPKAPRGVGCGEGVFPSPEIFLILDLKMAICDAFLVQFLAVQLKL